MPRRLFTATLCAGALAAIVDVRAATADEPPKTAAEEAKPSGSVAAPAVKEDRVDPQRRREHESYSPYEQATIKAALKELGAEVDHAPDGKIIEHVDYVRLEVIEERDPAPAFLNWFHWTTRRYVLEQDTLVSVGSRYSEELVDETARKLRANVRLSLVLAFAVKGSREGAVRLVIITKDVWSLRLNSDFRFAGGKLETIFLQPSEENIFGTHNSIALQVSVNPASYSIGGRYSMPHLAGSQISFSVDANVIMNRELGKPEGSFGTFVYGQPLYSTRAKWSWGATLTWRDDIFRRFCPFDRVTPCAGELRAFDATSTDTPEAIPYQYRSEQIAGEDFVTRSFGTTIKHDVSIGLRVSRRRFHADDTPGVSQAAAEEFARKVMPVSDTAAAPFIEYSTYSARSMHVLDLNTLGLTEDVTLGHKVRVSLAPVLSAFGSTRSYNYLHLFAAARYSAPLGDGVAIVFAESETDIAADSLPDASIEVGGRIVTPRLGFGRLIFDARALHRYRNYLNGVSSLGGSTRLRGYPTQAFLGKDVLAANLEFRTRPVEILSCQLGGAAFFDAGDAWEGEGDFNLKQSAGFGIRVLFPQFNRVVMRADWGFPLTRGYREPDSLPGDIVVTFRQAFPTPDIPTAAGIE